MLPKSNKTFQTETNDGTPIEAFTERRPQKNRLFTTGQTAHGNCLAFRRKHMNQETPASFVPPPAADIETFPDSPFSAGDVWVLPVESGECSCK
jgi:hypothetical protein